MKKALLLLSVLLVSCAGGDVQSNRPPRGNPNAVVIVEEFADLQCPACRAAHATIQKPIVEKYGKQIRFEFEHFPIRQLHRFALDLAEMSECVADQGKFWEYVDKVYEKQLELDQDAILGWAEEVGVNRDMAEKCWKSHAKRKIVLAGYKDGRDRGVAGTPTFFVNGKQVETDLEKISAAIEGALKGAVMKL